MKRGLTQQEAMANVGARRRTWEANWAPRLTGIHQGVCLIYDRQDLKQVSSTPSRPRRLASSNPRNKTRPTTARTMRPGTDGSVKRKEGTHGPKHAGYLPQKKNGTWEVDKWWRGERFRARGLLSYEEAQRWLIKQLAEKREVVLHGARQVRVFGSVAAHYLLTHQDKASLETEAYMLESVRPFIGHLELPQIHDATLAPYVPARKQEGRANKTINLALGVVRRILNPAAAVWRDQDGRT